MSSLLLADVTPEPTCVCETPYPQHGYPGSQGQNYRTKLQGNQC